jgi:hypothetical protein
MIRRALLLLTVLGLAACGDDAAVDAGLGGTWKNTSSSLAFDDGDLVRKAGRVTQKGRYKLYDVKDGGGRVVIVLDGQKLTCRFTVKGKTLTLAEPCAANFDGGSFTRAG